jgi:uncharacterized protein
VSTHLVQVDKGEEVIDKLNHAVQNLGIMSGPITIIGAVDEATISVMRKNDAQTDLLREYQQPFELSGTGEVTDGRVHLHVTLAGEDMTVSGHLHRAVVDDFFVRAYLTTID